MIFFLIVTLNIEKCVGVCARKYNFCWTHAHFNSRAIAYEYAVLI